MLRSMTRPASRSLRRYLVTVAVMLAFLIATVSGLFIWRLKVSERRQAEVQLLDTTRAMSLAMDGELRTYEALLLSLRASPAAQAEDWPALDAQARRLLSGPSAWIVVGDRTGRQLVNTRLPPGARLPSGTTFPEIWPELDKGHSRVCNLARGYLDRQIVCVDVPLMRDGRAAYHLSVVFRPSRLAAIMTPQQLGPGRIATVLDRSGRVIWRNVDASRFAGLPATAEALRAIQGGAEAVRTTRTPDGRSALVAFNRSTYSGWTFSVAMPRGGLAALDDHGLARGGLAFASILLAGLAAGLIGGRRVSRAVEGLNAEADRLGTGAMPKFEPTGLTEIDQVGRALAAAAEHRRASQERFDLAQEVGGIGAWDWDAAADQGHVSDSYKRMHGLADMPGPLRLRDVTSRVHPDDLPGYLERLRAATVSAAPSTNDYRVVHPGGVIRWISAKGRPIFDETGALVRAVGIVRDVTAEREAEARLHLLMREVDHRANNLMTIVQGAVRLTRHPDADVQREIILGRLHALARAHQLLSESRWAGADLRLLAQEELAPFALGEPDRVRIEGRSVQLPPAHAQAVAMALHELATNAAKHGALGADGGGVRLSWAVEDGVLKLAWRETGGPPVRPPETRGFGTTVLQRALGGALGGSADLDWRPEGLACDLTLPL